MTLTDTFYGASGNSPPVSPEDNFWTDPKIDHFARGIYAAMLGDPWKDTAEAIAGQDPPHGQGRRPVLRALNLLEAQGYVERVTRRNKGNGMTFQVWRVVRGGSTAAVSPGSTGTDTRVPETSSHQATVQVPERHPPTTTTEEHSSSLYSLSGLRDINTNARSAISESQLNLLRGGRSGNSGHRDTTDSLDKVTWKDSRGAVHSDLDYDDPAATHIRGLVEDICAKWRTTTDQGAYAREQRAEWTTRHNEGRPA